MTVSSITGANSASAQAQKSGFAALDQGDFLRLMTEQLKQQDPFAPVDNKEMLAQMAQFSSLASTAEMGETLKAIAEKLDAILAAQQAANQTTVSTSPTDPNTSTTGS